MRRLTPTARLLIAVLLAMVAFTVVVLLQGQHSKHDATRQEVRQAVAGRASCIGGSQRTIYQLRVDFDIYHADYRTAHSPKTVRRDRIIRGQEANRILTQMKRIAADRIRYWDAAEIPEPLSGIIRRVHFSCVAAYPLPPGGLHMMPPPLPSYPQGARSHASH